MPDNVIVSRVIPATPQQVYEAWLDSEQHSEMTGSAAACEPGLGGSFTAWDGYISGTNLSLEPHRRIFQTWRTSEFPVHAEDARLEVLLEPSNGGTLVTLVHTNIPDGDGPSYEAGWHQHYFDPMTKYFHSVY